MKYVGIYSTNEYSYRTVISFSAPKLILLTQVLCVRIPYAEINLKYAIKVRTQFFLNRRPDTG